MSLQPAARGHILNVSIYYKNYATTFGR